MNLYGFVGNDGLNSWDAFGNDRGKFTIVHKPGIPLSRKDAKALGKSSLDGFEVRFVAPDYEQPRCDKIKLVQAIARSGAWKSAKMRGKSTKLDTDDVRAVVHRSKIGDDPIPDYRTDGNGNRGENPDIYPHSYRDAPHDEGIGVYTIEVCAFCHRNCTEILEAMDTLIGCVTFYFDQDTRRTWLDKGVGTKVKGEDAWEATPKDHAGPTFMEGLKNWGYAPGLVRITSPDPGGKGETQGDIATETP